MSYKHAAQAASVSGTDKLAWEWQQVCPSTPPAAFRLAVRRVRAACTAVRAVAATVAKRFPTLRCDSPHLAATQAVAVEAGVGADEALLSMRSFQPYARRWPADTKDQV